MPTRKTNRFNRLNSQPSTLHRALKLFTLSLMILVASCFSAKQETANNLNCELLSKSWKLEFQAEIPPGLRIASESCKSPECLLSFVVSGGIVTSSSLIVSGSIVLVGNTLHWLEKQGKCETGTIQTVLNSVDSVFKALGGSFIETKDELLAVFTRA